MINLNLPTIHSTKTNKRNYQEFTKRSQNERAESNENNKISQNNTFRTLSRTLDTTIYCVVHRILTPQREWASVTKVIDCTRQCRGTRLEKPG